MRFSAPAGFVNPQEKSEVRPWQAKPDKAMVPLSYTSPMVFMVIERFKNGDTHAVGERFRRDGRMLPEGVAYINSWVEPSGSRCFQVMEAPDRPALQTWIENWSDLVDFEVIPVVTSAEFWAGAQSA